MVRSNLSCAIIGINGYLGSNLAYFLYNLGYTVYGYDIQNEIIIGLSNMAHYSKVDITNKQDLKIINTNVDVVLFFSGLTGTKAGFDNYAEYVLINEIGLLNILNLIAKSKHSPRVVFPSTRLVYMGCDKALKENDELLPKTIYAQNKIAGEHYLEIFNNYYNLNFTIYRICIPYGNVFSSAYSYGTIGFFLNQAQSGKTIKLFGDGKVKRTFTHIEYLAHQIIHTMHLQESENEIYNIDGETQTLKAVADLFAYKYKISIDYVSWPEEDLKIESNHTYFCGEKIKKLIKSIKNMELSNWINNI
jgi:UDP-glucose 4-epimerase